MPKRHLQGNMPKTLIIVTGPTGSGKTELAIQIAESLHTEIVSADSRQIYRDIPIGTAAPTSDDLSRVKHHFVSKLNLDEYYSAAKYEEEALNLLDQLWRENDYVVMCGGSMMYIDAITNGIDELPTISEEIRRQVMDLYAEGGLKALHDKLIEIDPEYLSTADPNNHRRLMHAIEITLQAGVPSSSLRTGKKKSRPFKVIKLAIGYSRKELFDRINNRVEKMIDAGLEEEARRVYSLRNYNSLNTVGYKEMFAMMDGVLDRDTAIARIAKNTRVYAKKQMLWLSKNPSVIFLDPHSPMLPQALKVIKDSNEG